MRHGLMIDFSAGAEATADLLQDYERAGTQIAAVAEAYTFDAVSRLGFLAARTTSVEIASSILQVYSRTPALLAMTAAGLDFVSGGRFTLGIGASGPQVVEGFHGVPFDAPVGRTREVIDICRKVWRREALVHDGKHYSVPLPAGQGTGLGKPLKLINHPVRDRIPVSIAALGPSNVALAAELAEGWQPMFFHPQRFRAVWGEALEAGYAKRNPELGPLDIMLEVSFAVGEVTEETLAPVRRQLALYMGGMGARDKNFYNQLVRRYGYESEAAEVQNLYLAGRKTDAAKAVPDDLVRATSLVGTKDQLADQIQAFHKAGVTTLLLKPLASDLAQRVKDVATFTELTPG